MKNLIDIIWTEKYRPSSFEDLILKPEDKEYLGKVLKDTSKLPNFFFYSHKPGTGKTSTAYLIIKLLGCDKLILNASDERGIDTIRNKIDDFTKTMSLRIGVKKAVLLDEADYLTSQAQASLRNLMEETHNNAFFILTANYEEKVIEALRSRCICMNFNKPPKELITERLNKIIEIEKIESVKLEDTIKLFYPDIRKMILSLQAIKQGLVPDDTQVQFRLFLDDILKGKTEDIRKKILSEEINVGDFTNFLFNILAINKSVSLEKLGKICEVLAKMDRYLSFNINPKIVFFTYLETLKKCLTLS
jgi:DNA polymerase III delta prime subunit